MNTTQPICPVQSSTVTDAPVATPAQPKPSTRHWARMRGVLGVGALGLLCATDVLATSAVGTRIGSNFTEMETIINATRLIVVAAAVIFSGYQIAFNNKRFGDVWPILLGGLVVGAAGGFASYFVNLA